MERVKESHQVTIGWGLIGDVRQLLPEYERIREVIAEKYPDSVASNHRNGAASLFDFAYNVDDGDLVIVKHHNWRKSFVVQIVGDYGWLSPESAFGDYQNYRAVKILPTVDAEMLWRELGGEAAVQGSPYAAIARLDNHGNPTPAEARTYLEGARAVFVQTAVERNPSARAACLHHHGYTCCVCSMNFAQTYGHIGDGFIHIHHLNPIANANGQRTVDPKIDLVPVCPNCHAMLHTSNPPLTPGDLRTRLKP